jgi:hypothetical protein
VGYRWGLSGCFEKYRANSGYYVPALVDPRGVDPECLQSFGRRQITPQRQHCQHRDTDRRVARAGATSQGYEGFGSSQLARIAAAIASAPTAETMRSIRSTTCFVRS